MLKDEYLCTKRVEDVCQDVCQHMPTCNLVNKMKMKMNDISTRMYTLMSLNCPTLGLFTGNSHPAFIQGSAPKNCNLCSTDKVRIWWWQIIKIIQDKWVQREALQTVLKTASCRTSLIGVVYRETQGDNITFTLKIIFRNNEVSWYKSSACKNSLAFACTAAYH